MIFFCRVHCLVTNPSQICPFLTILVPLLKLIEPDNFSQASLLLVQFTYHSVQLRLLPQEHFFSGCKTFNWHLGRAGWAIFWTSFQIQPPFWRFGECESPAPWEGSEHGLVFGNRLEGWPETCEVIVINLGPSAAVSRDGLVDSCTCRRCKGPPARRGVSSGGGGGSSLGAGVSLAGDPQPRGVLCCHMIAWWERSAFTLTKRTCLTLPDLGIQEPIELPWYTNQALSGIYTTSSWPLLKFFIWTLSYLPVCDRVSMHAANSVARKWKRLEQRIRVRNVWQSACTVLTFRVLWPQRFLLMRFAPLQKPALQLIAWFYRQEIRTHRFSEFTNFCFLSQSNQGQMLKVMVFCFPTRFLVSLLKCRLHPVWTLFYHLLWFW